MLYHHSLRIFTTVVAALALQGSRAEDTPALKVSITGDALAVNGGKAYSDAQHWTNLEASSDAVYGLLESAQREQKTDRVLPLAVSISDKAKAPWGALQAVLAAGVRMGLSSARILIPDKHELTLALPGAESDKGEVVDLPLSTGDGGALMTENGGKKMPCTTAVLQGMVKQLPKATINIQAQPATRAAQVAEAIDTLTKAHAAAISYLPPSTMQSKVGAMRKKTGEAEESVNKALGRLNMGVGQ